MFKLVAIVALVFFSCYVSAQDITVPSTASLALSLYANGTQNYSCNNGTYVLVNPSAILYSDTSMTNPVGTHFFLTVPDAKGGFITFNATGGQVVFQKTSSVASPNANSIPQLLLTTTSNSGTGVLSMTTYGQRLNTVGGVAPSSCVTNGSTLSVIYTATYAFYTPVTSTTKPSAAQSLYSHSGFSILPIILGALLSL